MDPKKLAELESAATAAAQAAEDAGGADEALNTASEDAKKAFEDAKSKPAPSQSSKEPKTEKEKAAFSLKKNADRLKELGGDPAEALGINPSINLDDTGDISDDTPVTFGTLRKQQLIDGKKAAIKMGEALEDETERTLVVDILSKRLVPSGNPEADLAAARAIANTEKNSQIAQEAMRRTQPKDHSSGGGAPAAGSDDNFTPTAQEAVFMGPPYNLSKEQIIAARPKA